MRVTDHTSRIKPMSPDAEAVFHMRMTYACDRCGTEIDFLLEDGLEGPRAGGTTFVPYAEVPWFRVPPGVPRGSDWRKDGHNWRTTPSGRLELPVPFIAAGCPKCQGQPPWRSNRGVLQHVKWERDKVLDPPIVGVPKGVAHFRYPSDPKTDAACGIPVVPEPVYNKFIPAGG